MICVVFFGVEIIKEIPIVNDLGGTWISYSNLCCLSGLSMGT